MSPKPVMLRKSGHRARVRVVVSGHKHSWMHCEILRLLSMFQETSLVNILKARRLPLVLTAYSALNMSRWTSWAASHQTYISVMNLPVSSRLCAHAEVCPRKGALRIDFT